jgi:hypothetical protein
MSKQQKKQRSFTFVPITTTQLGKNNKRTVLT